MKQISSAVAALLIVLLTAFALPAFAQGYGDPNAAPVYYSFPISTVNSTGVQDGSSLVAGKTYANSQTDTLAYVGGLTGATYVTYTFTAYDSVSTSIYVDYQPLYGGFGPQATKWNRVDSTACVGTVDTINTMERALRIPGTERIGGIAGYLRIRVGFAGSNNGTTSAVYAVKFNWMR